MTDGMPVSKYRPAPEFVFPGRTWPSTPVDRAPRWCSVDLRDGHQSLSTPMSLQHKLEMFRLLCDTGFREIEVGFPASSRTEYDFVRLLITANLVPDDVCIQVITQCRPELISRTFASLQGVRRAIVNFYLPTSAAQRTAVLGKTTEELIDMAVAAARKIRRHAEEMPESDIRYLFAPEGFTHTEPEFALKICGKVLEVLEPSVRKKVLINLPASVENVSPNVYADMVEWFCGNIPQRDHLIIGAHVHNDRGTAVAASEMALQAGADRIEGTLFGIGERAGNADLVTIALNMFAQGIDPHLYLRDLKKIRSIFERCTGTRLHDRHPYAGDMVYTTFAGSHQDAVRKALKKNRNRKSRLWDVPYLPIDPSDVGMGEEPLIRLNRHSGKGGAAYMIEKIASTCLTEKLMMYMAEQLCKTVKEQDGELHADVIERLCKESRDDAMIHAGKLARPGGVEPPTS